MRRHQQQPLLKLEMERRDIDAEGEKVITGIDELARRTGEPRSLTDPLRAAVRELIRRQLEDRRQLERRITVLERRFDALEVAATGKAYSGPPFKKQRGPPYRDKVVGENVEKQGLMGEIKDAVEVVEAQGSVKRRAEEIIVDDSDGGGDMSMKGEEVIEASGSVVRRREKCYEVVEADGSVRRRSAARGEEIVEAEGRVPRRARPQRRVVNIEAEGCALRNGDVNTESRIGRHEIVEAEGSIPRSGSHTRAQRRGREIIEAQGNVGELLNRGGRGSRY